jgi:hypothetical protein
MDSLQTLTNKLRKATPAGTCQNWQVTKIEVRLESNGSKENEHWNVSAWFFRLAASTPELLSIGSTHKYTNSEAISITPSDDVRD